MRCELLNISLDLRSIYSIGYYKIYLWFQYRSRNVPTNLTASLDRDSDYV